MGKFASKEGTGSGIGIASATQLGIIRVGANLTIDVNGILNASGGAGATNWGLIGGTLADQTDLVTALGLKLNTASYTANDVLTKLLTVDGAGSTLDADLLDGQHGAWYAPLASPTFTGKVTITSGVNDWGLLINSPNSAGQSYGLGINAGTNSTDTTLIVGNASGTDYLRVRGDGWISLGHVTPTAPLHLSYTGTHKLRITHTGVSAYAVKSASDGTSWYMGLEHDRKLAIGRNDVEDIVVLPTTGNVTVRGGLHVGGTSDPGDNNLLIDGYVRSSVTPYASQTTGWNITQEGAGDFRYLYADELHAKAFIADLEQALAGGQIICKSVAPLAAAFTIPAAGASETLVVESFMGFDTFKVFVDGDMIRLRQFERTGTSLSIANCWGTVVWVSTDTDAKTQTYTFTRSSAPNAGAASGTIGRGVLALDYGTTGNGFLESTAIDGAMAENAPYHQIVSWTTHPNSGLAVRTRLGNLKGITSVANEYGLIAGDGFLDSSQYLRISNVGVEAHNIPIKMYDGAVNTVLLSPTAPSFAMGATLPTGYLSNGSGIWMGKDTDYKMRVGTVAGGVLTQGFSWDNTTFSIIGNVTATTGSIGGWVIGADSIKDVAGTVGLSSAVTAGDDIRFFAGHVTPGSAPFRVTEAGIMTAEDAVIHGKILYKYELSNDVIHNNSTVRYTSSTVSTELKWIILGDNLPASSGLTLRIYFQLASGSSGTQVTARIARNGNMIGTVRSNSNDFWVEYNEDLGPFYSGDRISIYGYTSNALTLCNVQNLAIKGTHAPAVNEVTGTDGD